MPRSPSQKLADHLLGQPLEQWVRARRTEGKSWRIIARDLYLATDHQLDISDETLRLWLEGADQDPDPELPQQQARAG